MRLFRALLRGRAGLAAVQSSAPDVAGNLKDRPPDPQKSTRHKSQREKYPGQGGRIWGEQCVILSLTDGASCLRGPLLWFSMCFTWGGRCAPAALGPSYLCTSHPAPSTGEDSSSLHNPTPPGASPGQHPGSLWGPQSWWPHMSEGTAPGRHSVSLVLLLLACEQNALLPLYG